MKKSLYVEIMNIPIVIFDEYVLYVYFYWKE